MWHQRGRENKHEHYQYLELLFSQNLFTFWSNVIKYNLSFSFLRIYLVKSHINFFFVTVKSDINNITIFFLFPDKNEKLAIYAFGVKNWVLVNTRAYISSTFSLHCFSKIIKCVICPQTPKIRSSIVDEKTFNFT